MFSQLPAELQLTVLSKLFSLYLSKMFSLTVPEDFLFYATNAMLRLSDGSRTNVFYNFAKGIGTLRPDKKRFTVSNQANAYGAC